MHKIENVILDLGGVLYTLDFTFVCDGFYRKCGKTVIDIQNVLYAEDLFISYETGKISSFQYYDAVINRLAYRMSFQEFKEIWNSILVKRDDMFRFTLMLKRYANIFILSNTNELNAEVLEKDLLPITSKIIYSFKVGCMKPDQKIYRTALEEWCITPEKTVFIDDLEENVAAARLLGIHSHLFSGARGFINFLKKARILPYTLIEEVEQTFSVSNRNTPG